MISNRLLSLLHSSRSFVVATQVVALSLFVGPVQADQNWDGDNPVGNFSFANNWFGNTVGGSSGFGFGNGSLHFSFRNNGAQASLFYDFGGYAQTNDILWDSTFGAGLTLNGNGQGLDFNQRLENNSSFTQTIGSSMNLSGAKNGATQIELNPVNGNLVLNGAIFNDNSRPYQVYGNNANTLTVNTGLGVGGTASNVSFNINQNSNVIFTANQTYAGATVISAGSLQIGNGSTTGSLGTGAVTNNAALAINRSDSLTVANSISGTGSLSQSGGGTTILTGTNSYGTTTISAGTLQIGSGSTNGSLGTGAVTNNATLAFNRSNTLTVANDISGTGNLTQSGAGTTILTGTNSYDTTTISAGTLQIGNGGTTGSLGTGAITNNGALVFNRLNNPPLGNTLVSSAISGSGSVTQSGTNLVTLAAANSYTGLTTVSSGRLLVGVNDALGSTAAGTVVSSGASLRLTGVNYTTAEALSLNGPGITSGTSQVVGGALANIGTSSYAGAITITTSARISSLSGALTLSGGIVKDGTTLTITGGTGSVILNGTGISGSSPNSDLVVDGGNLVVNAASNYNGPTTVQNGGTLEANAAIDTTTLTVDSTSTLAGSGSINAGAGSVFLNGNFIVGNTAGGAPREDFNITAASTIAGANSTLKFDLFTRGGDLTATPAAADLLNVTGSLSLLSNVVLDIASSLSGWTYGDKWNLWDVSGTTTGTVASISSSITLGPGLAFAFDESNGVLSIVPEPSRALFLMLGLLGISTRRRRK